VRIWIIAIAVPLALALGTASQLRGSLNTPSVKRDIAVACASNARAAILKRMTER
jgi:hypothetical protein